MSDPTVVDRGGRLDHPALRLDAACDRFEAAWRAGHRPRIEDCLIGVAGPERADLLRALLQVERDLRRGDGADPDPAEYRRRFPGDPRTVAEAFADAGSSAGQATAGTIRMGPPRASGARPGPAGDGRPLAAESGPAAGTSRFRILRRHARGGLGDVFVAYDRELRREVAVKEIRPDRADDGESRARFVLEAEITGHLEHPGIVPVYGRGEFDDGRPFYAMRFVRGDSFKAAIAGFHAADGPGREPGERALALRGLLRRFIDVCNAIDYAHSRGVLHRDIKPANIMLGDFGETLVVDWGLAKAAGRPEAVSGLAAEGASRHPWPGGPDPTAAGSALGTPAFMSPEQAAGEPGRLGPRSDVYGLGATLYCLLTGRAPLDHGDGDTEERLRRARAGDIAPPRHVNRLVPPALEAVCRKAMATRPEDRYDSARALADDLEQWLADEPVSAWREPWTIRMRRWGRRHRTGVAATAAACAAALVLGGIVLYSYQGQVRREAALAEAALVRGEQARSDARAAWADRLDVTAWGRALDLASTAAALDSRRLPAGLCRQLHDLADGVSAEAARAKTDAAMLADLAAARAGWLLDEYDSAAEYRGAFERRGLHVDVDDPVTSAAALGDRPATVAIQIASCLDDWSVMLRSQARQRDRADRLTALARILDPDPWRNALRDALSLPDRAERRQVVSRMAAAPDAMAQPSSTTTLLAVALRVAGEADAAIPLLQAARFRYPEDPWVHQELGWALLAAHPPRREDALRAFTATTTLRPEMGHALAMTLEQTGRTREAIDVLEGVARRSPRARYLIPLGFLNEQIGRVAESRELFRRAEALSRRDVETAPDDYLANHNLAESLRHLGDRSAAVAASRKALLQNPRSPTAHNNFGWLLRWSGDLAGAIAEFKEAIRLDPDLALAHAHLGDLLSDLRDHAPALAELRMAQRLGHDPARMHLKIGAALRNAGDLAGAIAELREAIRLKPDSAEAHNHLGLVLRESGDLAGSFAEHREALRLNPTFSDAHNYLGVALRESGDLTGGIAELREAIRLKPDSNSAHNNLGCYLMDAGDLTGAVVAFREAIHWDPNDVVSYFNLGHALRALGRFREALVAMERGHKLVSGKSGGSSPSADWVKQCRRDVDLEDKLPAILSGRDQPADAAERADLGTMATLKKHHAAAVRLFAEAFAERPALADDVDSARRYNAACSAALAACGRGGDERQLSRAESARYRAQAFGWLKADLEAQARRLEDSSDSDRIRMLRALRHCRTDPDFAGVRDPEELAKLPEPERREWQDLWAALDAVLRGEGRQALRAPGPPAVELPADVFAR